MTNSIRVKCNDITIEKLLEKITSKYTPEQRKKMKVYVANNEELDHIFKDFYIDTDNESGFIVIEPIFDNEIE